MKLAKEQLANIYHTERQHLDNMYAQEQLTVEEYNEEVSELVKWVQETFDNETENTSDNNNMLLMSKDFILAHAKKAEELYEEFHYAQDYYTADELHFVSSLVFLTLMKTDNLTSH